MKLIIPFFQFALILNLCFRKTWGYQGEKKNGLSPDKTRALFDFYFGEIHPEIYLEGYNKDLETSLLDSDISCRKANILSIDCYASCFLKNTGIFGEIEYNSQPIEPIEFSNFDPNSMPSTAWKESNVEAEADPEPPIIYNDDDDRSHFDIAREKLQVTRKQMRLMNSFKSTSNSRDNRWRKRRDADFDQQQNERKDNQEFNSAFKKSMSIDSGRVTANAKETGLAVEMEVLRKWLDMLFPRNDEGSLHSIRLILGGFSECVWRYPRLLPTNYFGDCSGVQDILDCLVDVLMGDGETAEGGYEPANMEEANERVEEAKKLRSELFTRFRPEDGQISP